MKRFLTLFGAAALALASTAGLASAQNEPVNADGSYVVANDDGAPMVSGAGEDLVYGDINTGGGGGQVLGDPSAIYTPITPDRNTVTRQPGAGDGLIGGIPIQPAAPDATTNTTTNLDNNAGSTTENVPIDATGESAPVETTETAAAPTGFCGQYGTWYDAQVAYENLGATGADAALVQEVDPDWDGIACEGVMA